MKSIFGCDLDTNILHTKWLVDLMQAIVNMLIQIEECNTMGNSFSIMLHTYKMHKVNFCSVARVCSANLMLQYHVHRKKFEFI